MLMPGVAFLTMEGMGGFLLLYDLAVLIVFANGTQLHIQASSVRLKGTIVLALVF
jgi:hypothetical protein